MRKLHICTFLFVPITQDGRLVQRRFLEIRKTDWWQDEFWKHMAEKYPDLERGDSSKHDWTRTYSANDFLKSKDILPDRLSKSLIC